MPPATRKFRIGLGSFDLIKGFCIINVVLFHSMNMANAKSWPFQVLQLLMSLSVAAMPTFFIISGYGFRDTHPKTILKKTFSDLMIPYIIIALIYAVLCPFTLYPIHHSFRETIKIALGYFLSFVLGNKTPGTMFMGLRLESNVAAYFFLKLFIALNVLNLVLKLKKPVWQIVAVVACNMLYQVMEEQGWLLFGLYDGLSAVPLCYLGYWLKQRKLFEKLIVSPVAYAVLIAVTAVTYFIDLPYYPPFTGGFLYLIYEAATGLLTAFIGVLLGRIQWRILDPLKTIGMRSYWVLAIHAAEQGTVPWQLLREYRPVYGEAVFYAIEILIKALIITVCCIALKNISRMRSKKRLAARVQARSATKTA